MRTCLCRLPRSGFLLSLAVGLALAGGCQKGPSGPTVSGKVLYKDSPIRSGTVQFYNDAGLLVAQASIRGDGTYILSNVAPGEVKICVQVNPPPGFSGNPMQGGMPGAGMQGGMAGGGMMGAMPKGAMKDIPPEIAEKMRETLKQNRKMPMMPPARKISDGKSPPGSSGPTPNSGGGPAVNADMLKMLAKLNKKYGDAKTTPLTCSVGSSDQQYDIVLSLP